MKLYIAVLDQVPDYITPTLVAHAVLGAHLAHMGDPNYDAWLKDSFKKCVVRVNEKEFAKISTLPGVYLAHESKTLSGIKSCAVPVPCADDQLPNVLRFAKLWKPVVAESVPPRQGYISPEFLAELQAYSSELVKSPPIQEFLKMYKKDVNK